MNVVIICGILTGIAVHAGLAIFYYGRLTQKVAGHGERISKAEDTVEQHHGEIGVLYGHAGLPR